MRRESSAQPTGRSPSPNHPPMGSFRIRTLPGSRTTTARSTRSCSRAGRLASRSAACCSARRSVPRRKRRNEGCHARRRASRVAAAREQSGRGPASWPGFAVLPQTVRILRDEGEGRSLLEATTPTADEVPTLPEAPHFVVCSPNGRRSGRGCAVRGSSKVERKRLRGCRAGRAQPRLRRQARLEGWEVLLPCMGSGSATGPSRRFAVSISKWGRVSL